MNNNLFQQLKLMSDDNKSIKIGIIGIGKFSTMFLSQARVTKGLKILALADLKYSNVENVTRIKNILFMASPLTLRTRKTPLSVIFRAKEAFSKWRILRHFS